MTKQRPSVNVGIDVGKATLDVYLLERDRMFSVPNEEHAISALVSRLSRYRLERVVIEATGRLEQPFVRAAVAKGLPVVVVSPLKIRRFAGAIGQLAKTDEIDARLIARFASTLKPVAHPTPDAKAQLIKDLIVRRRQLTSLRTMEKNRRQIMPEDLTPASIASSRCSTRTLGTAATDRSRRRATHRLATQTRSAHLDARHRPLRCEHSHRRSA